MLHKITNSAGAWALWKGLDWAFERYFIPVFSNKGELHPELARASIGLSDAHMSALLELGREGSPLRRHVEEILEQEYPDFDSAADDISRRLDEMTRAEAEVLVGLMLLGKQAAVPDEKP
ncbi:hypothetical protein IT575_03700 [bacterium]|nr:hypothetical protein [bacterium]